MMVQACHVIEELAQNKNTGGLGSGDTQSMRWRIVDCLYNLII